MKKQIVFVESMPNIFTNKISKLFKEKGYETILISFLKFNEANYKDAYSKMIKFDLDALSINFKNFKNILKRILKGEILKILLRIKKLNPYVIIGSATPYPIWIAALTCFISRRFRKPFIFFPYDVSAMRYPKIEYYDRIGIPRFEHRAERYCFEKADGLFFKGGEEKFVKKHFKVKGKVISFAPYCSENFIIPFNRNKLSKKDNGIHFVYIGNIENEKEDSSALGLGTWEFPISKLIEQKIHFHVYSGQYELIKNSKVYGKFSKSKYFHLHKPLSPKEIIHEISKYDYGCWFPNFNFKISRKEFVSLASGNKMASFLEAGIPFFYVSQLGFVDSLMKKYQLSLTVDIENPKGFDDLRSRIKKLNYKKLEKNIEIARKEFTMEKQFLRFEEFVKKLGGKAV